MKSELIKEIAELELKAKMCDELFTLFWNALSYMYENDDRNAIIDWFNMTDEQLHMIETQDFSGYLNSIGLYKSEVK